MSEHKTLSIFDDGAEQFQGEQRNYTDPDGPNCQAIDPADAIILRCNHPTSNVNGASA